METLIYFLPILIVVLFVMYLLYRSGITVTKSIAAVSFLFLSAKSNDRVSVSACTGWVRHRLQIRESGNYEFTLDSQPSKGNVQLLLLDRNTHKMLHLNTYLTSGKTALDRNGRYYLRWEFTSATGKFNLHWHRTC